MFVIIDTEVIILINNRTKDILADILRVGELGSRIICRPELSAPWGLIFPTEDKANFHVIKKGSCLFYLNNKIKDPVTLHQGDVLFIPKVNTYSIISSTGVRANHYLDEVKRSNNVKKDKTDTTTRMICGSYKLKSNMSIPFFSLLPGYIHLTSENLSQFPELGQTVQMLIKEDYYAGIGSDLIIARVLDILLVQIVRFWLSHCKTDSVGWLMATLHDELGKVLSLIHEQPEKKWTIDHLAKETAMSRTKLFNEFTKTVGISPFQYLTNWRVELSKQLLTTTSSSILEIANAVGYESEASFGRVFKKIEMTSPGKFRSTIK